jgi:hypothetical protein
MLAVGLGLRFGASVGLALTLAVPAAERWSFSFHSEPAREEISLQVEGRAILADLYRPGVPRGALLLVHGLSRAGRRQPDLARLAWLLARHDRLVLVPQLDGLAAFRLGGREIAEVRAALGYLVRLGHHPIGLAGFSFGAGPALLAAADVPELALTASFGGYADLRHVATFLTTGAHGFEGERRIHPPEEYNRWKLIALLAPFVQDDRDRRALDAIAERRLRDPAADTGALEMSLGAAGRSVQALALNRAPDATPALLAALPRAALAAMDAMSPLAVVSRLPGRLVIAHGAGDASIPFTESLRLAAASGGRARAVILTTFHHTGPPDLWHAIAHGPGDALRLVHLTDALLHP